MNFLDRKTFTEKALNPYWTKHGNRFAYMSVAIDILKRYDAKAVLELGAKEIPLTSGDTMDITAPATYIVDASIVPWPIKDKQYDFFVALQVFEHLDVKREKQVLCFNEARRISNNIVISLPFNWVADAEHTGINDSTMLKWSSGLKPTEEYIIGKPLARKIYFWRNV